jgi:RNA recognition motif-containing protein
MAHPALMQQQLAQPAYEAEALRNLMINYIPTQIDEIQLRQLFEMYGPIESIKIVCDRETKHSKGYGFVKYRFAFSAMHAIQYLNGYPLMNKRLKVGFANQNEAQKAAHGYGGLAGAQVPFQAMPQAYQQGMPPVAMQSANPAQGGEQQQQQQQAEW